MRIEVFPITYVFDREKCIMNQALDDYFQPPFKQQSENRIVNTIISTPVASL